MAGKNGGRRPGAGRKPGQVPKAVTEMRRAIADMAREHAEDALLTLTDVCKGEKAPAAARVSAASALLDRGYGKPPQHIQQSFNKRLDEMSDEEILATFGTAGSAATGSEEGTSEKDSGA